MSIDAPLNAGNIRSLGSVIHSNLVSQQPNGSFKFLSDPSNVAAMYADNIVYRAKLSNGEVSGITRIDKFGAGTIGTSLVPISGASTYQTPTSAVALEFVSDDANDGIGGTGAQTVSITGIGSDFNEITQELTTNGLTPVPVDINLLRMYRWKVISTGSYANETTGSHIGNLTIRGLGGGVIWDIIENTPFPAGQSHIGAYTIPRGKTGFLVEKSLSVDSNKSVNVYFFCRDHIDDITSPYTGVMRLIERDFGITGTASMPFTLLKGPFIGPVDIGALAQVSVATAEISISFSLLLLDT